MSERLNIDNLIKLVKMFVSGETEHTLYQRYPQFDLDGDKKVSVTDINELAHILLNDDKLSEDERDIIEDQIEILIFISKNDSKSETILHKSVDETISHNQSRNEDSCGYGTEVCLEFKHVSGGEYKLWMNNSVTVSAFQFKYLGNALSVAAGSDMSSQQHTFGV